jgi:hypothetical protein
VWLPACCCAGLKVLWLNGQPTPAPGPDRGERILPRGERAQDDAVERRDAERGENGAGTSRGDGAGAAADVVVGERPGVVI